MKAPHALSIHAPQLLPLLGWLLLFTTWRESRRTLVVLLGATGYVGLVTVMAFQTFSGRSPLDVTLPAALTLGMSVALLGTAYLLTFVGVLRQAPDVDMTAC